MRGLGRNLIAVALGAIAAAACLVVASAAGLTPRRAAPTARVVAEDASAPLARIAIHYAPAADDVAMPVWRQLFAALPARVEVEVAVARTTDFARFQALLDAAGIGDRARFHPVIVGHELTTWSRDRFVALTERDGGGAVLAPPRIEVGAAGRAGDMAAPDALARAVWDRPARRTPFAFEGGDLAASARTLFVGAEVLVRSRGRGAFDRASVDRALRRSIAGDIVWLGDQPGDVPHHHVMMYMVPLDDREVLVGDPAAGAALAAREPAAAALALDADQAGHQRRFDHVAALLAARGLQVRRIPVVVLADAGSYVTYTNALFDREPGPRGRPIVYLPTYRLPALDAAAARQSLDLGYLVRPIDVSSIYQLNGSLGCLVNVMARGG